MHCFFLGVARLFFDTVVTERKIADVVALRVEAFTSRQTVLRPKHPEGFARFKSFDWLTYVVDYPVLLFFQAIDEQVFHTWMQ
jgi:hypothetical protein